ncbi:MAG: hypothetical protein HUJ71_02215, partial [Pseudobutyrivibrio sp.]|nr:hypothetical protein [Pseudobutyrivibrio sp.]
MKYEDSAQTFLESYDDAIPAASYVRYSNEMYHYGELGVNYNTALNKLASQYARKVMPSNVLKAVYEEGVKSNKAESKENKKVTSIKSKGTGKVTV